MTQEEIIERLANIAEHAVHFAGEKRFVMSLDDGIALNLAIKILTDQEPAHKIEIPIYDREEIHHGCVVQVLTNTITGETSVGWWKEEEYDPE